MLLSLIERVLGIIPCACCYKFIFVTNKRVDSSGKQDYRICNPCYYEENKD